MYSLRFSRYKLAASALAGEFGLGSWSRDWIEVRIAATSYVGDHRFCKMSKHNSPFAYTFGWNIFDTNLTVGGLFGYVSSNWRSNLNVPSSNGVSPTQLFFFFVKKRDDYLLVFVHNDKIGSNGPVVFSFFLFVVDHGSRKDRDLSDKERHLVVFLLAVVCPV